MSSGFQPPSKSSSSSSITSLAWNESPAWSTTPVLPKYPGPIQLLDESWNVHAYILEIKEEMAAISKTMAHVELRLIKTDEVCPVSFPFLISFRDIHRPLQLVTLRVASRKTQ
jgi:hypothetical protein